MFYDGTRVKEELKDEERTEDPEIYMYR